MEQSSTESERLNRLWEEASTKAGLVKSPGLEELSRSKLSYLLRLMPLIWLCEPKLLEEAAGFGFRKDCWICWSVCEMGEAATESKITSLEAAELVDGNYAL